MGKMFYLCKRNEDVVSSHRVGTAYGSYSVYRERCQHDALRSYGNSQDDDRDEFGSHGRHGVWHEFFVYDNGACGAVANHYYAGGEPRLPWRAAAIVLAALLYRNMVCTDRAHGRCSVCPNGVEESAPRLSEPYPSIADLILL